MREVTERIRKRDGARLQCPNEHHREEPLVQIRTASGQIKTVCQVFGCPNVAQWVERTPSVDENTEGTT